MQSLLARIERGLTFEVRLIVAPEADRPEEAQAFKDLESDRSKLKISSGPRRACP